MPKMDADVRRSEHQGVYRQEDRQRHSRHRFIERLYIGKQDGMWYTGMTYEISGGGLSAATTTELTVGDKVKLSPVVDKRVNAIVRRKKGAMYGFEFVGLTTKIEARILKLCEGLPLFQSLIDV